MRLLLGSGGFGPGDRREKWKTQLDQFLGSVRRFLFVPYALKDHDSYAQKMIDFGFHADREMSSIHKVADPVDAVQAAEAIFIGGGNSFRLLAQLQEEGLLEPIRKRVREGAPYIGISAGTNMACPTLKTTNDMPIVQPKRFESLGLIDFQINPHYFSGRTHIRASDDTYIEYAGETRDDRIREYHEMNDSPVLGLWEGEILQIKDNEAVLCGTGGARLFNAGKEAQDFDSGASLTDHLLRV